MGTQAQPVAPETGCAPAYQSAAGGCLSGEKGKAGYASAVPYRDGDKNCIAMFTANKVVSLLAGTGACARFQADQEPLEQEETTAMAPNIEAAQAKLTDRVMALPGVVGIGIGECEGAPCIKVFVVRETEELDRQIPSTFEGFPVEMQVTGEFFARPLDSP